MRRYVGRLELSKLFLKSQDRKKRKETIYNNAHIRYGYTLKEIADYLNVHYTTISKIIKEVEGITIDRN